MIVCKTRGAQAFMTTTTMRSIVLTAMATAVLFFLVASTRARAADPRQTDKDQSKKMKKTDSGLEYLDVNDGSGEAPKTGQTCVVQYTGWLWKNNAKGKKFDSSVDRGTPFSFHLGEGEVIKGWDEGVSMMKVGAKRELLIPPDLAWGARGSGGVIPANATVFFEVELLEKWEKTESGLEYVDIKEGTGTSPKIGQICVVHYTGWLWQNNAKGRKFGSSLDRREPLPFPVGESRVIKGWDEGVSTMKVGGKRRLLIPAKLGYGRDGFGAGVIPPDAILLFEVELLKVR
jgi:FKBP-type peptidyl-prolyl cis-trans isomerase